VWQTLRNAIHTSQYNNIFQLFPHVDLFMFGPGICTGTPKMAQIKTLSSLPSFGQARINTLSSGPSSGQFLGWLYFRRRFLLIFASVELKSVILDIAWISHASWNRFGL
jgi:hypothetical protein